MDGKLNGKTYKSPMRKLAGFFVRSRDQWKAKCQTAKAMVKRLQRQVQRLVERQADLNRQWQSQVSALEADIERLTAQQQRLEQTVAELQQKMASSGAGSGLALPAEVWQMPARHQFPLGCIELYVSLVTSAVSLRGAAGVLTIVRARVGELYACPAWTTGRLWLLRVGYYQLMRPKVQAADWVWVVDHTVQIGQEKCLVILGVRLSEVPAHDCMLCHELMELLALLPVQHSNGPIVAEQLEATVAKTGVPREILSDHGTDLKAGVDQFCEQHPETVAVYDIVHKIAAILKRLLDQEPAWQVFTHQAQQTARQLQQTALAALMPPKQKSQARYLNIDALVHWGQAMLVALDHPATLQAQQLAPDQVQAKLGWLTAYRPHLAEWGRLFELVSETETVVRHQGLHAHTRDYLARRLQGLAQTPLTRQLRQELLGFVAQEAAKARPGERLLGSSEIIESVLGKQKQLERDQAKNGFTGLILGLGALVAKTSREVIRQALETVSTQQVLDWCREMFGRSVQSQRRALFAALADAEQKRGHLPCTT